MNTGNLRPFNTMPPEEHRELSRRGGIASGARRRYLAELRMGKHFVKGEFEIFP